MFELSIVGHCQYTPCTSLAHGEEDISAANRLYFGDCLEVMRENIPEESVDLIYLDPPFNSKRLYNAFIGGAQWVAFDDTWRWHEAIEDFDQVAGRPRYKGIMEGLRMMLGEDSQLAYMANRLVECHRVLKPTGSIYLHCDLTMSHYLKTFMDAIFGHTNFQNEIVWRRTTIHRDAQRLGRVHDIIFFYSKGPNITWNTIFAQHDSAYVESHYTHKDADGRRYRLDNATAAGQGPARSFFDQMLEPPPGTHWRWSQENIARLTEDGRIVLTRRGKPAYKRYLDEMRGTPVSDDWADIPPINSQAKERLGYSTLKPIALLQRIIEQSSNPGDVILDPFCGCGTAVHAAQNLNRQWIGIDICVNACKIIEQRLQSHFDSLWSEVEFIGMPKTSDDAKTLADLDKFRFERWAAALVDGMEPNKRQRGDKGIDGWGRLPVKKGQFIDVVSQVKGGGTGPGDVQAFNGARQQASADLGFSRALMNE